MLVRPRCSPLALAAVLAAGTAHASPPTVGATRPGQVDHARASARTAYREAERRLQAGEVSEAVAELDAASELDPGWSAPVRLRAETFAGLSRRHGPNEALLMAEARPTLALTGQPVRGGGGVGLRLRF